MYETPLYNVPHFCTPVLGSHNAKVCPALFHWLVTRNIVASLYCITGSDWSVQVYFPNCLHVIQNTEY